MSTDGHRSACLAAEVGFTPINLTTNQVAKRADKSPTSRTAVTTAQARGTKLFDIAIVLIGGAARTKRSSALRHEGHF
jgi:uncharacterized Rossmann fold enzyme